MQTFDEGRVVGDVVLYEAQQFYSRGTGTVAQGAGATHDIGTVLGRVTATEALVPYDPDASNGAEKVAGVLISRVDATAAAVTDAILIERHARVKRHALVWGAGVATEAERTAGVKALRAIGIITDV
ncbi:head decoration protein [Frigidibacter sp. MR17.14]|uniref:head decoration protein n=1 Tax=Frigidibacter sp. MR17.14 TaxID=3126509 RepID=UPI003012CE76